MPSSSHPQSHSSPSSDDNDAARVNANAAPTSLTHFRHVEELRKEFKIGKVIGRGTFGEVRKCKHKRSKRNFALKTVPATDKRVVDCEAAILSDERMHGHKHIIRMHRAYQDEENVYLLFDYCAGGDTIQHIDRATYTNEMAEIALSHFGIDVCPEKAPTTEQVEHHVASIIAQVLSAVQYCHDVVGVVHRDIKPGNIMIENRCYDCHDEATAKLIDFGLAQRIGDTKFKSRVGTVAYAAPEVMDSKTSSDDPYASDIWSVGAVAYSLLYSEPPFTGKDSKEMKWRAKHAALEFPEQSAFTDQAKDFISKLLSRDPTQRPTAKQALQHEWLQPHLVTKPRRITMEDDPSLEGCDSRPKSKIGRLKSLFSRRKSNGEAEPRTQRESIS